MLVRRPGSVAARPLLRACIASLLLVGAWRADRLSADTVSLKNGTEVVGKIVGQSRTEVLVNTERGPVTITKDRIRRITYGEVAKKATETPRKKQPVRRPRPRRTSIAPRLSQRAGALLAAFRTRAARSLAAAEVALRRMSEARSIESGRQSELRARREALLLLKDRAHAAEESAKHRFDETEALAAFAERADRMAGRAQQAAEDTARLERIARASELAERDAADRLQLTVFAARARRAGQKAGDALTRETAARQAEVARATRRNMLLPGYGLWTLSHRRAGTAWMAGFVGAVIGLYVSHKDLHSATRDYRDTTLPTLSLALFGAAGVPVNKFYFDRARRKVERAQSQRTLALTLGVLAWGGAQLHLRFVSAEPAPAAASVRHNAFAPGGQVELRIAFALR